LFFFFFVFFFFFFRCNANNTFMFINRIHCYNDAKYKKVKIVQST